MAYTKNILNTTSSVMVKTLDYLTNTNVFESYWVPHSYAYPLNPLLGQDKTQGQFLSGV